MTVKNLTEDNMSVLMALCLGYAKISIKYAKESVTIGCTTISAFEPNRVLGNLV